MNKTFKAAMAASTAGVLLIGGASTLAFWKDAETVTGGSVSSGELQLTTPVCDTTWSLNGGAYYPAPVADDPLTPTVDESRPASLIVPGDTVTKTCSYLIEAAGDNLQAALTVTNPTETGALNALNDELTVAGAYKVDGVAGVGTISDADNGETLEATITVSFPFGVEDNESQNLSATLSGYTVTATQTDATP